MLTKPSFLQKIANVGNTILSLCLAVSLANFPFSCLFFCCFFCFFFVFFGGGGGEGYHIGSLQILSMFHLIYSRSNIMVNKQNYLDCPSDLSCVILS